ncbi:hypothetical protein [Natronorarus salvus]|uniref:hypothetical protein n=1 Tax=Natronorarus salvus TaxID=3117733 RepID=UPI002F26C6E3
MGDRYDELREDLADELARTLATIRGGQEAGKMARRLLSRDRSRSHFIGITTDGRVVLHEAITHSLIGSDVLEGYVIDPESESGEHVRLIAKYDEFSKVDEWIADRDPEFWAWLHPRFRWLVKSA